MANRQKDYDSTVARIAGNIASGAVIRDFLPSEPGDPTGDQVYRDIAEFTVSVARAIVQETKRTEPDAEVPR